MSAVSTFLDNLFSTLFKDEAGVLQPVADTYLSGIISDPSPDNVVAQSLAYQASALAVLPKVESVGLFDTASALKAFLDAQVPSLVASATAVVVTTPAADPVTSPAAA